MKKDNFTYSYIILASLIIGIIIPIVSQAGFFLVALLITALATIPFFFILLKNQSIGVLIITFLLPFEQIGGIPIADINVRLSQLVFLLTFAAWIINGLFQRNLHIRFDRKLLLLTVFLIISIISFSNTINLFRSVQILVFICFTFLVYIFISSYPFSKDLIRKIILTLFISMVATSLFGLFQFAGDMVGISPNITRLEANYVKDVFGFPRIQSTANEPLNYANYLILPLSISFALFSADIKMKVGRINLNKFYLPILILGGIVMVLTFSRGGWGALFLSFLILSFRYLRNLFNTKNILLISSVLIISFLGITAIATITNAPFTTSALIGRMNVSDFSAGDRIRTTNEGLKEWRNYKLTGIGLGSYGPLVAKYENIEPETGWQTVNNEYAELLIETGIIGLAAILFFWLAIAVQGFLQIKKLDNFNSAVLIALLAALLGMLLQYISFSTLYVFHLWFLSGLINNKYFEGNPINSIRNSS